jgi:iron complex outermembrane receptor protein
VKQRAAVQDAPNDSRTHEEVVTATIDSRIFGQHLSYVGSYTSFRVNVLQESGSPSFGDVGNILPGVAIFQRARTQAVGGTTQEFRLASDPAPGRFFDYTVGAYYSWGPAKGHIDQPGPLTPGAFGSPALPPNMQAYNPAYQIPIAINLDNASQETSIFGSVTLHLPWDTELSGGIRHMWSIANNQTTLSLANGQLALPASLFGGNCAALGFTSTYAGYCDFQLAGGTVISNLKTRSSETPNIYNVSLSHHFTRDFLAYVNTGTAYRPPVASVGIQGQLANFTLPDGSSLSFHPSETSRSYEVGYKSTWLDGRWRLNASMFRQRFHNFTLYVPNVSYNNVLPGAPLTPPVPTTFNFTTSVDALVQGFDVDTAFQITPNWSASAQLSYADGKVEGSQVPCNITDTSGNPVYNTGGLISLCPGGSASRLPLWNATFQSEYVHPVSDKADGFLRVLATYYPENKNRAEPNFTVDNYSLLNLYAGVRSHDGAWEVSLFARNALNVARATDISSVAANLNTSLSQFFPSLIHPSGYFQTSTTPPREVGINVHYAFGSR